MAANRLPAGQKYDYRCNGGPLLGTTLWLSTPNTLTFTLNGQTGFYKGAHRGTHLDWQTAALKWNPAQQPLRLVP